MIRPGFYVVLHIRYTLARFFKCVLLIYLLDVFANWGKQVSKAFEFCLNRYDLWLVTLCSLTLGLPGTLDS